MRLEAPTLEALFIEAALALAEVMGARGTAPEGEPERVELRAIDRDALLFEWLNELIFRAETEHEIFTEVRVERLEGGELDARIRGERAPELRTVVKAATFHGLHITEGKGGFSAAVVLDV